MSARVTVTLRVNGRAYERVVEGRRLLVDFLRHELGLHGTHVGCEQGVCGACTVLLDGEPVKSCLMLAPQAQGRSITTVEGLAGRGELHPVQQAFRDAHALQCGYCTPGFLLGAVALANRGVTLEGRGPARGAGGQPLPVHGLPEHRRGGRALPAPGRRGTARWISSRGSARA